MFQRLMITVACGVCGAANGHRRGCSVAAMRKLQERNVFLGCPKCDGKVGLNKDDYYECRSCHAQLSTSGLVDGEGLEEMILVDHKNDKVITVFVLERKGKGEFPIDQAIDDLRKEIFEKDPEFDFEEEE